MAKDYVGPRTPQRAAETPTVIIIPPTPPRAARHRTRQPSNRPPVIEESFPSPLPVRRTLRFTDPNIQPITDEEAAEYGIILSPVPEESPAEDRSLTEERFGVNDEADAQASHWLLQTPATVIPPHAPRTGVRRPSMGRRR